MCWSMCVDSGGMEFLLWMLLCQFGLDYSLISSLAI